MENKPIDKDRAHRQFSRMVNTFESMDVEVLLIPPVKEAQDQLYTANIGVAMEPVIVLSRYKSPARWQEVEPAKKFFNSLGYQTIQCPYFFEGRADCIKLGDKLYFGGVGQSSDPQAFKWMEQQFGVRIIPVNETDPGCFHLDCVLFAIDPQNVLVNVAATDDQSIKLIEQVANIIPAPENLGETGITNMVKIPRKPIVCSGTFKPESPEHRKAMDLLNVIFDNFGMSVVLLDCDEFDKSGADLSCCVMDLDF